MAIKARNKETWHLAYSLPPPFLHLLRILSKFATMCGKFILLLCCLFQSAFPQENRNYPVINAWMELGTYRITPVKHDRSAGVDLAIKLQVNKVLTTLQYLDCFDSEGSHGYYDLHRNVNHYHAGNMMVGITNRKCKFGHVSVSSGIGAFWGIVENQNEERFATIGFPMEAAASINIFPFAGINIKVFTNINPIHSFIGFGMDLQLGKMRDIDSFKLRTTRF